MAEHYPSKFAVPIEKNELNESIFSIPTLEKNRVIKVENDQSVNLYSTSKLAILEDVIVTQAQTTDVIGATGNEISCDENSKFPDEVYDVVNIFAEFSNNDENDQFYTPTNSQDLWSQDLDFPPTQELMKNQLKLEKLVEFDTKSVSVKLVKAESDEFYTPTNSQDLWSQNMDFPPTQELMKNQLKLVGNRKTVPPTKPVLPSVKSTPTTSTSSVKPTPTTLSVKPNAKNKWIDSGKIYYMSEDIYNEIFDAESQQIINEKFYYRNDFIGIEVERIFPGCVMYVPKYYEAKTFWRLSGYCAHNNCREYRLLANYDDPLKFTVLYDKLENHHQVKLTRQVRKKERDDMKEKLKQTFPNHIRQTDIIGSTSSIVQSGNYQAIKSLPVYQQIRVQALQAQDNEKDDIADIEAMISDDPKTNFISDASKLSRSNFAVYIHAKNQHDVLHKLHKKREADGTPVIVRTDATGNIARDIEGVIGKLLYYALTVNVKILSDKRSTALPLAEQYNIRHKSKHISQWFFDFITAHNLFYENPPILFDWIITDFSYANFHAILKAFNALNLRDYLNLAYEWISQKHDGQYPESYSKTTKLMMFFTHIMHTFADMTKRHYGTNKKHQMPASKVILEILASMIRTTDYEILLKLWQQLCILLTSKYINDDVTNAVVEINEITSKIELDDYSEEKLTMAVNIDELPENVPTLYKNNLFYIHFSKILEDNPNYVYEKGDKIANIYYNLSFLEKFVQRFVPLIALWTDVLSYKKLIEQKPQNPSDLTLLEDPHNQPIESFFNNFKSSLSGIATTVGKLPIKIGRAITADR